MKTIYDKKSVILPIKAKHLTSAGSYGDCSSCGIAQAAKGLFKVDFVLEGYDSLTVFTEDIVSGNRISYSHEPYDIDTFEQDRQIALDAKADSIIRKIKLIKVDE